MPHEKVRHTFVTERQSLVHALFLKHRSMSVVARLLRVSQITVREKLVQYQRNQLRDQGLSPPSLKAMMRGDVTPRFNIPREESGGRPAKHEPIDPASAPIARNADPTVSVRQIERPASRPRRLIITGATAGASLHQGFWINLKSYAAAIDAEIVVISLGTVDGRTRRHFSDFEGRLRDEPIAIEDQVDVATDARIAQRVNRPLPDVARADAVWTILPHHSVQFETMTRVREDGLRIQMTTGAVTIGNGHRPTTRSDELGAVIVELGTDGFAHCRHILTPAIGDGGFQDLNFRVEGGVATEGARVEAITYGDLHAEHVDLELARATWGFGAPAGAKCLVDAMMPIKQVFHDVCDFSARSLFDARDHHKKFAQLFTGANDVKAEMTRTAAFIAAARRPWSECLIVASNHDDMLVRWLRESDFREDQHNALYFLELSLALHRRLAGGGTVDGFFEWAMRDLVPDGLTGVSFLRDGASHKIAGTEVAIHGHKGPDGRNGGFRALEPLGLRATIGHTHRPTSRGGLVSTGVCQTDLHYARGTLTSWAAGHVITYFNGARQHLLFHGGRFHV